MIASMYHPEWITETTDGTKWCSTWLNTAKIDGTEFALTATNGFNGKTKCTWFIKSEDGTVGPGIYLKEASYTGIYIHWVEWIDTASLGTDATMPASDGVDY